MLEVALLAAVDADVSVRGSAVRLVANKLYQMLALTDRVNLQPTHPNPATNLTISAQSLSMVALALCLCLPTSSSLPD